MKTLRNVFGFLLLALTAPHALSAPFDTGFITWVQPNSVQFTARMWGGGAHFADVKKIILLK